jgi:restriction system protein
MKIDRFVIVGSRVERAGSYEVEHFERDPDKLWLGTSQWYLDLSNYSLTHDGEHDGEHIGTCFSVDPSVLLHTQLLSFGDRTPDGRLVKAPSVTWFEVSNQLSANPAFRFEFCVESRKFEEFLAGTYRAEGWEHVTLTPRSGDKGRDVIAELNSDRILQEAKAYSQHRLVTRGQVSDLYGVLKLDPDATKAIITTTADFAPGVKEVFRYVMPHNLETVNGEEFVAQTERISTAELAVSSGVRLFESLGIKTQVDGSGRIVPQRQLLPPRSPE